MLENFLLTGVITYKYGPKRGGFDTKRLTVEVVHERDYRTVYLHGGPTGYESFILTLDSIARLWDGWCACMGTEGRYHKLDITGREMQRLFAALGCDKPRGGII